MDVKLAFLISSVLALIPLIILTVLKNGLDYKVSVLKERSLQKLVQPSAWYFNEIPKVNTMGFDWTEAQRQFPGTVYTSHSAPSTSPGIFQSPGLTYESKEPSRQPSDIIYQNAPTVEYSQPNGHSYDYIPQYSSEWRSSDSEWGPQPDFVHQTVTTVTNAGSARSGPPSARQLRAAQTQSLSDNPSFGRLDAIQAELDSIKKSDDNVKEDLALHSLTAQHHSKSQKLRANYFAMPADVLRMAASHGQLVNVAASNAAQNRFVDEGDDVIRRTRRVLFVPRWPRPVASSAEPDTPAAAAAVAAGAADAVAGAAASGSSLRAAAAALTLPPIPVVLSAPPPPPQYNFYVYGDLHIGGHHAAAGGGGGGDGDGGGAAAARPGWAYRGHRTGPARWGQLREAWGTCGTGRAQSPINVELNIRRDDALPPLALQGPTEPYQATLVPPLYANALTLDGLKGTMDLSGLPMHLRSLSIHTPSEHRFDGQSRDGEVELLFQKEVDSSEVGLGLSAFLVLGETTSPCLIPIVAAARGYTGNTMHKDPLGFRHFKPALYQRDIKPPIWFDTQTLAEGLLGHGSNYANYLTYLGSLTTPPCTEGVTRILLKVPLTVTPDDYAVLAQLQGKTARPTQPLNGRVVYDTATGRGDAFQSPVPPAYPSLSDHPLATSAATAAPSRRTGNKWAAAA